MTRSLASTVVLLAALGARPASAAPPANPAPDQRRASAAVLFQEGSDDLQAGRTEQGCHKLEESVATMPDSRVMAALAECKTALGNLGDAWELWRDLVTSAATAELRDAAASNAAALDKQLARVAIRLRGTAPPDLVVTLNGKPVNAAEAAEHRVAPGKLIVVASAPELEGWTQRVDAKQGATVVVEIDVAESQDALRRRKRGRVAGLSLVAVGATVLAVAAVYGGSAYLDWRSANASCGGDTEHCPSAGYPFAQTELASARRSATIASWSTAIGLGTTALGLLIGWSFRSPGSARTGTEWRASPVVDSHTVGLALTGSLP